MFTNNFYKNCLKSLIFSREMVYVLVFRRFDEKLFNPPPQVYLTFYSLYFMKIYNLLICQLWILTFPLRIQWYLYFKTFESFELDLKFWMPIGHIPRFSTLHPFSNQACIYRMFQRNVHIRTFSMVYSRDWLREHTHIF